MSTPPAAGSAGSTPWFFWLVVKDADSRTFMVPRGETYVYGVSASEVWSHWWRYSAWSVPRSVPSLASVVRLYVALTVPPVDSQATLDPVTKLKAYFR